MAQRRSTYAALVCAALAGGCSNDFAADGLWPSLDASEPAPAANNTGTRMEIPPSSGEMAGSPTYSGDMAQIDSGAGKQFVPIDTGPSRQAPNTGTFVGQKVATLRSELENLKSVLQQQNQEFQRVLGGAMQNAQRYHAIVGAVSARLQVGTTPGNPVLVSQWNQAQSELDRMISSTAALNSLSNRVSSNSDLAAYLLQATRAAFGLQGAVDEDHRQLSILEDDVNRTVVSIDRLLNEINEAVTRQNTFEAGERRNLSGLARAISNGEVYGPSLANFAYNRSASLSPYTPPAPGMEGSGGTAGAPPLVVIRFDRPNVDYQQALYSAVSKALEQRPGATFEIVGVTPERGTTADVAVNSSTARRRAEQVMQTLVEMGLPVERVQLSSAESVAAQSNEVHVYVR